MSLTSTTTWRRVRRPGVAAVVITLTVAACVAGVILRAPLRCRYWAWRLTLTDDPAPRGVFLAALCNAGDDARGAVDTLLAHRDPGVRQWGVLVLHHARGAWARVRLLRCLSDPDSSVQRLAVTGLAIHGDDATVPPLKRLYLTGDSASAVMACLVLERLASAPAVAALNEMSTVPADAQRRTALVNALAGIGLEECRPGLEHLLSDFRACPAVELAVEMPQDVLDELAGRGYRVSSTSQPGQTIAERAAQAIGRIEAAQDTSPPDGNAQVPGR